MSKPNQRALLCLLRIGANSGDMLICIFVSLDNGRDGDKIYFEVVKVSIPNQIMVAFGTLVLKDDLLHMHYNL